MKIKSLDFKNNQKIPSKFTCDGEDINPTLVFEDIPKNSKSLVLIVDDPDAPMGTWVHWTLWNIPKNTKVIKEGSKPQGAIEGVTSFGKTGYGGPCPPSGTHRYFFKLYALDTELNLNPSADINDLKQAIEGHVIDYAELVGLYSRE